jgi:DUF438 domain-containing protein
VDLVKLNNTISKLRYMSPTSEEYTRLLHVVSHLSGGEHHIEIEEKTIFPELEKAGLAVLPTILAAEHFDLRYYTQQLQELVYRCCTLDFDEFKRSLDQIVCYIVPLKQEHIFKEDNMLYPIAFGLIKEETAWRQLHVMWEQVGYRGF